MCAMQKPERLRSKPRPPPRPLDAELRSPLLDTKTSERDPDDQTRDHLDGQCALWDVPNECDCQLFTIPDPHSISCVDHGMDPCDGPTKGVWAALLMALSPAQFADPPPPPPSTAKTHVDRLNALILRFDAGVGLWNRPEDAYRPDDPNATPHLAESARRFNKQGLLIIVLCEKPSPAITAREAREEILADLAAERLMRRLRKEGTPCSARN